MGPAGHRSAVRRALPVPGGCAAGLPDMKYGSDRTGEKYSGVGDYFSVASSALAEMRRQRPRDVFDKDGIMKQGMIVRHLVLPANVENSKSALDFVARLDRKLYVSLLWGGAAL